MKKLIPILLSAMMLTGCAGTGNNQTNTYRQINMDEAVKMMAEESDYIILDVRRPDEFAAGHIPNAINVPNETIGTVEIPELPDMYGKNLTFKTGGVDGCDCEETLKLIAEGKLDTEPLITHTYPLSKIDEAYELFENKRDGVIKVAVEC